MNLKREDVEAYLHWHSVMSEAKEHLDELKSCLLPALREGLASPSDLPLLVERRTSQRVVKDYKTPLLAALKRILGTTEKAEKRMVAIEDTFETKDVESVHVVVNKAYVKEEMAGTPARLVPKRA